MSKIEQKVKELMTEYGTAQPYELCDHMGITVLTQDLPESVNGFTVRMYDLPFIVINRMLGYYERRITTAHELGHIVLHNQTNSLELSVNTSFCVNKYEREADCFAAYLLLYAEQNALDGLESITTQDVSRITHIPQEMANNAFSE